MKYDEKVDDVGAIKGGHVEHKDDLDPFDKGHRQDEGQGPG